MKRILILCFVIALCAVCSDSSRADGSALPLKFLTSCEIDLNGDNVSDVAMLVETVRGRELIVLLKTAKGYDAFLLSNDRSNAFLSCQYGTTITETTAGPDHNATPKIHETPGTYIELGEPEGACSAFFWNGTGFQEVWIAD